MALKGVQKAGAISTAQRTSIAAEPLASGPMRQKRFSSISPALAQYLDAAKVKTSDGKSPSTYCERAERVLRQVVQKARGIREFTESIVKEAYGGTSLMNNSYELRNAIMQDVPGAPAMSALDLVLVGAAMHNAEWLNLADAVNVKKSHFNPVPSRAEQRASKAQDPYDVRPPVRMGTVPKSKMVRKDPYEGKQGLAPEILAQEPFAQAIAFFSTYEKVPLFVKFELFPRAYDLAGEKPEILAALLLPESIGTFSSRAAFYTDLKNALSARKSKITSIAVAEKIVQNVLSNRALGKIADYDPRSAELLKAAAKLKADGQKQQELPEIFIKSFPPLY